MADKESLTASAFDSIADIRETKQIRLKGGAGMTPIDVTKALGVALLILVLDLACAYVFVSLWAAWIEPGHDRDFVVAAAPRLSTISTRIAGPLLFAVFIWGFSRKRLDRNPFLFATAVFVLYVLLDGASVAFYGFFSTVILLSLVLKLIGALVGAALSRRSLPQVG